MSQISVIIPTYNGAKKISNILKALEAQTFQDFETIVVVDGSTDNTLEVIQQGNFNLKSLKIIHQANGGRAVSRNRGAKEAENELLIFFDDDTRPLPNSVFLHLEHFQTHKFSILVGNVPEDLAKVKTDLQVYRAALSRKWVAHLAEKQLLTKDNLFLAAANLSLPASLFWELEGFDENLTDAEDFDLGVRAVIQEIPIYFEKENIAWHDDFITIRSYIRRQRQYKTSHEKLKALKPEIYSKFNQYEASKAIGLKKLIYRFFAFSFWIWTIEKFNWLKILPQPLRYKIYDIIIAAYSVHFPEKKI